MCSDLHFYDSNVASRLKLKVSLLVLNSESYGSFVTLRKATALLLY